MQYISAQEAADRWEITKRRVQVLCASGRINGAARIGNMWVLPENSEKPGDARHSKNQEAPSSKHNSPIRIVRKKLRHITQDMIRQLFESDANAHDTKMAVLTIFSAELLLHYIQQCPLNSYENDIQKAAALAAQVTGYPNITPDQLELYQCQRMQFRALLTNYPFCCDDILSWCYQYINKFGDKSAFGDTQFFTEKYMITTLVDAIDIHSAKKILDPACGGGNFLLYCFDVLSESAELPDAIPITQKLDALGKTLFGYEIDPELAMVASINLRLKYLSILASHGHCISMDDFLRFSPNIFYPAQETTAGALDICPEQQRVRKFGSQERYELLSAVLHGADVVITNPPFRTIKGMPEALKSYLKAHYPTAKCDMCNAFIQMLLSTAVPHGTVGVVSQNSWMYLDSFTELRADLMKKYSLLNIWELGSNAFYDLSGEKANAVLMIWKTEPPPPAHQIKLTSLKELNQASMEIYLSGQQDGSHTSRIHQQNIAKTGCAFNLAGTEHLRALLEKGPFYGKWAVPMQGTSTGNAKELIDFYWRHCGDPDWIPVSKGGGYARWQGLNHYCVKWGADGSYIKATKGSAIRNAAHFSETRLVFSDTGTAGVNARILLDGQIFVASGPGIRSLVGNDFAHLAFLNSRFSSYCIHLISPKLTVAAGYIAKLPTTDLILSSQRLGNYAALCLRAKCRRLQKRPQNLEFKPVVHRTGTLAERARQWFLEDLHDEWLQLFCEHSIENELSRLMNLSAADSAEIDRLIGPKQVMKEQSQTFPKAQLIEALMKKHMDASCTLTSTRARRTSLGCDGMIEYLSQETGSSCEDIWQLLSRDSFYPDWLEKKYTGLYLHALALSAMGFPTASTDRLTAAEIAARAGISEHTEAARLEVWLADSFNRIHQAVLMNAPVFHYEHGAVVRLKGGAK